jgi:sugar lactone lactonase YvrE
VHRALLLCALGWNVAVAFGGSAKELSGYGRIPLAFEENRGQTDPAVRYIARSGEYSVFLTGAKAVLTTRAGDVRFAVSMQLAGARRTAEPQPEDPLPGQTNYFIGNDPARWRRGVRQFGRVRVPEIRAGVDMAYHGSGRELEYDLIVAPGADSSDLRLRFDGAKSLRLDSDGDLVIHTAAGDLRQHAPLAWQASGGARRAVEVRHVLKGRREVVLKVGEYDRGLPLTIDPVVSYSTYLGGSGGNSINGVAVDSFGNAYITGTTSSLDFPVTSGAYAGGSSDAYIAKLNPGGTALIYATYIGGSSADSAAGIAVDSSGNAFITGATSSSDFPIVFSGASSCATNSQCAFVAAVNSSGVISASRYLANSSLGAGIAMDSSGNPYVTGSTSAAFPVTTGSFIMTKPSSSSTGFVAKLTPSLVVSYGTYLGGTNTDAPTAIAVDSSGHAFIAGAAQSANFPTTAGVLQTTYQGGGDVFVTELNAQGSAPVYSTLLGGSSFDAAVAIAVDSGGSTYVAGNTQSSDFPTTPTAFLPSKPSPSGFGFNNSSFVAKVNPGGAVLAYSSYLGGSYSESASGVAVDASGNAYVLGTTSSNNFPTTPGAIKTQRSYVVCCSYNDGSDLYLSEFNPNGTSLVYSTYLGTSSTDTAAGIALDANLGIYVAGMTQSLLYATTASAFQPKSKGTGSNSSGFLAKIDFSSAAVCNVVLSSNSANVPGHGGSGSFTFTAASGCPWEITNDSIINVSGPRSGFGNGAVNYVVAQNQSIYSLQTGTIHVNGGVLTAGTNIFTVNQAAGSCTDPTFNPSSLNFTQAGGIENISVGLPGGCTWNLANVPVWITPSNSVNSTGSGTLSLYATRNSFSARIATITLATRTLLVTQAAGSCMLSLISSSATVAPQAVAGSIAFTTGSSCVWQAGSSVPWIQIGAGSATGQGSGSVSYVVAANPSAAPRAGSLLIGDQTFQITQSGGPSYIPTSYVASPYTSTTSGLAGDGGTVGSASVSSPGGLAFDNGGNLYIADTGNNRIRRVDPSGIITTLAGGGTTGLGDGGPPASASLNQPTGVAADASGAVYVADDFNYRIRKIANNVITTVAGTGVSGYNGDNQPATSAQIGYPIAIISDASGNIYFSDYSNNRIRRVSTTGTISTVAGTGATGYGGDGGSAVSAVLDRPGSLAIDAAGNLYVLDNSRVRRISTNGIITTVVGNGSYGSTGDGGPAISASIETDCCSGLALDNSGSIYIGESSGRIRKVTPDGIIQTVSMVQYNRGLVVDSFANLYGSGYYVYKLTPTPAFCTYTVSQPALQSYAGGNLTLQVSAAPANCSWTAASNASWLTVQTGSGSGNGSATFIVAGNSASTSRSGAITVAGLTLSVTQAALTGGGVSTATHFSVTAASSATAGVPVQFTVNALDASNHTVVNYSDPISLGSSDSFASLPANVTLSNGVGTFQSSLVTLGVQNLTASDLFYPSISGVSGGISVLAPSGLHFVPVTPCRVADTRNVSGPFGGPFIPGGGSRSFTIPSSACGIPPTAQAYSFNVAVAPHGPLGYVTVWAAGQTQPVVSTLNSIDGRIKSNAAIVPAGTSGAISVYATNDTDVILDINGYFVPASTSGALAFYPVTPCRLVDTRHGTLLSGPFTGGSSRTLPILSSNCNVPASAQAYSLNFTTVAPGQVGFLTAYPTGVAQPTVATLNALPPLPLTTTPVVVANAAIVPAGTSGSIDVFASNATDLVVDINGYFAPPGTGGLSLYNLPPCRVLDSRQSLGPGTPPFSGELDVNVLGSVCGGTPQAQGYVVNATVVPSGPFGFLTMWPHGAARPAVATLNALDGAITNNMAIVPTSDTEVSSFATNNTQLILDMFGYFAP